MMKAKVLVLLFIISISIFCNEEVEKFSLDLNIYMEANLFAWGLSPLPYDNIWISKFPISYTSTGLRIGKDIDKGWEFYGRINFPFANILTFDEYYFFDIGCGARYFFFSKDYTGFNASFTAATNIQIPEIDFFPSYSLWTLGWDFEDFYVDVGLFPIGIFNIGAKI